MNDIMKIVKSIEEYDWLIKGVSETTPKKTKNPKKMYFSAWYYQFFLLVY